MIYFTSDTHYGHTNIITYCNRPFKNKYDMDKHLIEQYNNTVNDEDTVYFLGDFAMGSPAFMTDIVSKLKGEKHFIMGNHDKSVARMLRIGFKTANNYMELAIEMESKFNISMTHIPQHDGILRPDPSMINLCGHVHDRWKTKDSYINVGVDVWEFKPVSLPQILDLFNKL